MDIKQFTAGMVTDVTERSQPKGTYRFALNSILQGREGKLGSLLSEEGNATSISVTAGHTIIGHTLTDTSDIILFTTDDTTSEIGIFNPDTNTYTVQLSGECLNFSTQYPIDALFRIRKGCERVIYFTDRNNPYRTVNLSALSSYLDEEGNLDCNTINFTRNVTVPTTDIISVSDTGGQLEVGSYQFAVRYLDEDLNPTSWYYVTTPVWIYDESQDNDFDQIDGAVPIEDTGDGVIGGTPITSKSISLSITNLDKSYDYIQIAALHSTSTVGITSTIYVQPELAIDGLTTVEYTYRGPDATATTLTDPSDIAVNQLNIGVVQTHAQLDNRLWLAGISSPRYNYADFQRVASNITVNWVTTPINAVDPAVPGNSKNPLTPTYWMSMMGDEVYALGIQFLNTFGEWSPEFHIPGRALIPTHDDAPYAADANTTHLGSASSYPKWKVRNTAKADGTLGYYEVDVNYPSTECDGQRVFPTGKIRHHRMPSRDIVNVNDRTSVYPIGLQFSIPEYPSDDIVGHRFLVSVRNESNSTCVDGGITIPLRMIGENYIEPEDKTVKMEYLSYNAWEAGQRYGEFTTIILTPRVLINSSIQNFDHIKFNYALNRHYDTDQTKNYRSGFLDRARIRVQQIGHLTTPTLLTESNRAITGSVFVKPRSTQTPITGFYSNLENPSYHNTFNFVSWNIEERLTGGDNNKHKYITLKRNLTPYSDLDSIEYRPLHHNPITRTSSHVFYGGDTVISELSLIDVHNVQDNEVVHANAIGRTFVESRINFGMTYGTEPTESTCDAKWKPTTLDWEDGDIGNATFKFLEEIFLTKDGNNWTLAPSDNYCLTGAQYHYNNDYSKINTDQVFYALANSFNYCSACLNNYPYRLMYSEKSFLEETSDNYRKFLANNRNDLLGSEGSITNLVVDKDQLYALTSRALWFIPTRPQSLQSNEATIYVGTGEALSIPPKRMITADHAYGGSTEQLSVLSTEFGTLYVDTVGRKIFLLAGQLREISQDGINSFFEDNIEITFSKQYKRITGNAYPYTNPTHKYGVGFSTVYDPRYKRIIIHKKDYELIESKYSNVPVNGRITFNSATQSFTDGAQPVEIGDPRYFKNRSWTISYSPRHRAWSSFHSYLPTYMFNDEDTFFSSIDNRIWEHNIEGTYQSYYEITYPHIIDFISNEAGATTQVFRNLFLHSDVQEYFAPTENFRIVNEEIFQQVVLYNTDQISGLRNIIRKGNTNPYVSVTSAPEDVIIEKSEGVWKLSNLRDYNSSHYGAPLFTSQWDVIQDQYYIDKIANPAITRTTSKTLFNTQRFRDEWLGVRLYYTPEYSSYRMVTDLAGIQTKQSFR